MKRVIKRVITLALLLLPMQAKAGGSAIKLEFGGTSMTIELSQKPKIFSEDGNLVLKTTSMSVTLSLPCKATFVGNTGTDVEDVVVSNNDVTKPLCVFTIDGREVGTLKDRKQILSLKRGIYIINGKKVFIK